MCSAEKSEVSDRVQRFLKRACSRAALPYLAMAVLLVIAIVTAGHEIGHHINAIESWIGHLGPWGALVFGVLSSVFDYVTFGVLMLILHATPEQFRTGWFVESVISASLVVLIIRSRRPFFRSRPGWMLQAATFAIAAVTLIIPYSPLAGVLGFAPLPVYFVAVMLAIVALYLLAAEAAKRVFYSRVAPTS